MSNTAIGRLGISSGKFGDRPLLTNNSGHLKLEISTLGCKRSWVQIPPVRPVLNIEITNEIAVITTDFKSVISAYIYRILLHFMAFIRGPLGEITKLITETSRGPYGEEIHR